MEPTKKQRRNTVDFNSFLNVSNKRIQKSNIKTSTSFDVKISKFLSGIKQFPLKISFLLKRMKRNVYKNFFWGRGMYYKYSVAITILLLIAPASVFASNIKSEDRVISEDNSLITDTAYDTGNGKTSLPNGKTIESIVTYVVQKGDTISGIAAQFNTSIDSLIYTNNLNSNGYLTVGQTLKIVPLSGILYTVQKGDTLDSIAKKYDIAKSGNSSQTMLDINLLDTPDLIAGQQILVPGAIIEKPAPVIASAPTQSVYQAPTSRAIVTNGGLFISPTNPSSSIHISTCFSSYHTAIDIDSVGGNPPLFAAAAGKVVFAGWGLSGGSGNAVSIDHGNGYVTQYLHLSRISVNVGDYVDQGQQIGIMGSTGRSTGTHVHFIIKYNGNYMNPMNYIDFSSYYREYGATSC